MLNKHPCGLKAMLVPIIITGILWLGLVGLVLAETTLQWNSPVDREDGAPLSLSEIYAYFIIIDGDIFSLVYGNEVTFDLTGTQYADGNPHVATLITMDTEFRMSTIESNSVIIPVPGPSAPVIICQP